MSWWHLRCLLVWPLAARSKLQGGQPKPKRPRAPKTSGDTGVRPYLEGTVVPLLMAGMQVRPLLAGTSTQPFHLS